MMGSKKKVAKSSKKNTEFFSKFLVDPYYCRKALFCFKSKVGNTHKQKHGFRPFLLVYGQIFATSIVSKVKRGFLVYISCLK